MIGKVVRGGRVAGLLHYLFGPGRANEHTNPHLAAAWDPLPTLQPVLTSGKHDLRPLTALLEAPLVADFRQHSKAVWHCALRTAPDDRLLNDDEWDVVAREVLDRTGLAPAGDPAGCRWVAVRHADDHVHLVVTLARQDGRPVSTSNDFYRVGQACRAVEERFDLQRTAAPDRTAGRRPTRAETEKAHRQGRTETPRVLLRRAVHSASALTDSPTAFFAELRAAGVLVRERRSWIDPNQVTGFAVAWPGDHTGDGQPVWFGGSKLAPELSWQQLSARWSPELDAVAAASAVGTGEMPADTQHVREAERADLPLPAPGRRVLTDPTGRREAIQRASAAAHDGAEVLAHGLGSSGVSDDVAAAGGHLIVAAGRLVEGRTPGPIDTAADRYQRAARTPWARLPAPSPAGTALRRAAHDLARIARARPRERDDVAELLGATASLIEALADLRAAQQRHEQVRAARESALLLRTVAMTLHQTRRSPDARTGPPRISSPQRRPPRGRA